MKKILILIGIIVLMTNTIDVSASGNGMCSPLYGIQNAPHLVSYMQEVQDDNFVCFYPVEYRIGLGETNYLLSVYDGKSLIHNSQSAFYGHEIYGLLFVDEGIPDTSIPAGSSIRIEYTSKVNKSR